jgi:UDP-N-acetylglucosamine--N-acetylmuramyl-(pentapeptide) pyrophosphoryl-undecaprenol N-acetylglucosamine transferase
VVLTSVFFGIPALLHEQNALPGKTNKLLAKAVKNVMVTFPESVEYFSSPEKIKVVGLPVREEVGKIGRKTAAAQFELDPLKKTLLITGGSRGALSINQAVIYLLSQIKDNSDIQLIWATGSATYESIIEELEVQGIEWRKPQWRISQYINNMPEAFLSSISSSVFFSVFKLLLNISYLPFYALATK